MIMPRGQQLLLPANPMFILFTLLMALFANMVVNISLVGNAAWMPDFLALVLVFWCVHQPRLVGIGIAFFLGVATDVHQSALLGQHALTYTALGFLAVMVHRRLLWFTVPSQAMQVLPLFLTAHALELTVRMMSGSTSTATSSASGPTGTPMAMAIGPIAVTKLIAPGSETEPIVVASATSTPVASMSGVSSMPASLAT